MVYKVGEVPFHVESSIQSLPSISVPHHRHQSQERPSLKLTSAESTNFPQPPIHAPSKIPNHAHLHYLHRLALRRNRLLRNHPPPDSHLCPRPDNPFWPLRHRRALPPQHHLPRPRRRRHHHRARLLSQYLQDQREGRLGLSSLRLRPLQAMLTGHRNVLSRETHVRHARDQPGQFE